MNRADLMAVRGRLFSSLPTALTSQYDFNRDGRVNSLDVSILRTNQLRYALALFTAPASAGGAAAAVASATTFGRNTVCSRA